MDKRSIWGKHTVIVILICIIVCIGFTATIAVDETTKCGKIASGSSGVTTYVKDVDSSITTPLSWTRYFKDTKHKDVSDYMKKSGIVFCAWPQAEDFNVEVFINNAGNNFAFDNLSEADNTQQTHYMDMLRSESIPATTKYKAKEELQYNMVTMGGYPFIQIRGVQSVYGTYLIIDEYATVINGNNVEFFNYYLASDSNSEIKKTAYDTFDTVMKNFTIGDKTASMTNGGGEQKEPGFFEKLGTLDFSLWVLIIISGVILLWNSKCTKLDEWQKDPWSLDTSKKILGLFALLIVMHHLTQKVGAQNAGPLAILEDFGVCLVGGFFLFSGYGLFLSLKKKPGYLTGFFKKRYPAILIPFYTCIAIFCITAFFTGMKYKPVQWIKYISGYMLINSHMWYIVEIALFYLVFYLFFRFIKNEHIAMTAMFAFLCAFTIWSLRRGHGDMWFQGEWWFNTSLVFFVGMLIAQYEENILSFVKKFYIPVLGIVTVGYIFFYNKTMYMLNKYSYWSETQNDPKYMDKMRCLSVQLPMVIFFVLLLLLICLKVKFGNKVLKFLGGISLELYLIHNIFIENFRREGGINLRGTAIYMIAVILASILLATLIHDFDSFIINGLKTKKWHMKFQIVDFYHWLLQIKEQMLIALKERKKEHKKPHHIRNFWVKLFRSLICIVIMMITLFPLYIMLTNASRSTAQIMKGVSLLLGNQLQKNFHQFFIDQNMLGLGVYSAMKNSFLIAAVCTFLAVYVGSLTAYGFEMYEFRFKKVAWAFVMGALTVPNIVNYVGFYKFMFQLGLIDTWVPLIIPAAATPTVVFYMKQYLASLSPKSLLEAGRIDGCREISIFHRIMLPVMVPALAIQAVFSFLLSWNNYILPQLILINDSKKTLPLFMQMMGGGNDAETYVGILVSILIPSFVYLSFSKYIVEGVALGAIKG